MKALVVNISLLIGVTLPVSASSHEGDTAQRQAAEKPVIDREFRELKSMIEGTYTNQEDYYFEENLGMVDERPKGQSDWFNQIQIIEDEGYAAILNAHSPVRNGLDVGDRVDFTLDTDVHGVVVSGGDCDIHFRRGTTGFVGKGQGGCDGAIVTLSDDGLYITGKTMLGYEGHFRRAKHFKCWVSPRKEGGSYAFYNDVALHDQGGRVWVEGDGHERVGLKMRNVVWAAGKNRPSLVLYTYQGDDEDIAVSYTWTSPDESRLGINLRWMQASCTKADDTAKTK